MDGSGRLVAGRSTGRPEGPESPLIAELVYAGRSSGDAAGPRYLLFVDVTKMRMHPLHSRLCASVAPVSAQLDPAESLRHAASACLSASATQMLWAASIAKSNRAALAFHLAGLGAEAIAAGAAAAASSTHVVTVSVMDMRGRTVQVAFGVKAASVDGAAVAPLKIVAA